MTTVNAPQPWEADVSAGYDRHVDRFPRLAAALLHIVDISVAARDALCCEDLAPLRIIVAGVDVKDAADFAAVLEMKLGAAVLTSPLARRIVRGRSADAWVATDLLCLDDPRGLMLVAEEAEPCTVTRRTRR